MIFFQDWRRSYVAQNPVSKTIPECVDVCTTSLCRATLVMEVTMELAV